MRECPVGCPGPSLEGVVLPKPPMRLMTPATQEKRVARAHGGEIRLVEGTIGATFRVTIPDRAVDLKARRGERARA